MSRFRISGRLGVIWLSLFEGAGGLGGFWCGGFEREGGVVDGSFRVSSDGMAMPHRRVFGFGGGRYCGGLREHSWKIGILDFMLPLLRLLFTCWLLLQVGLLVVTR